MSSRFQIGVIALVLALLGMFVVWYKVAFLDIPLTPHAKKNFYTISAEVSFGGKKAPAEISMALPSVQPDIRIVSKENEAGDFGYTVLESPEGPRALWSKRQVTGKKKIFYKVTVTPEPQGFYAYETGQAKEKPQPTIPGIDSQQTLALWQDDERTAAQNLIDLVRERSSSPLSFAAQLIKQFNAKAPSDSVKLLTEIKRESKLTLITKILEHEKIPVRIVRGIFLEDRQKGRRLEVMLEVYSDERWEMFSLKKGHMIKPENFFVWQRGSEALLRTKGVSKPKLSFAVTQTQVPVTTTLKQNAEQAESNFLNFSLFTLPSLQQNAFKQILLVPMGVLIVVILRILVGIRTMGTFMPVLFSLAFIQTSLLNGLVMFFIIVFSGLFIRFYLSRLRLLLVARISAVIIVVIGIMSAMSIISYKLGLTQALSVTFFPMIILSWTIERMSILWEEEGGREVMIQGSGSLTVAVLAYFVMINEQIAYLFFNFPELLLVILALVILIGRYTGYRVTELLRFAPLGRS